jgi:hypothetical protein
MGLRKGDMVRFKSNKVTGIIVGFKTSEFNSHYHKVLIHCIHAPYNSRLNGTIVEIHNFPPDFEIINRSFEFTNSP